MIIREGGGGWWMSSGVRADEHARPRYSNTHYIFTYRPKEEIKKKQHISNWMWISVSFLGTIIKLWPHAERAHTRTHAHRHTGQTNIDIPHRLGPRQGSAKPGSSPANPHSLRMNSMIACHHRQTPPPQLLWAPQHPTSSTFTPLLHMCRLSPPPPPGG